MTNQFEKKMQDRYLKILRVMVTHDENRFCFDCHQRGPTYVNMTTGSFVCTSCGGALRKYNHRVKSISMSNFSPTEIDFLRKRGNKACRKIYLALSDDQSMVERELKDPARDEYLRQKYQLKRWYREPTPELEAEIIKENQELMDRADQQNGQKSARLAGANAAAGLIVLPARASTVSASAPTVTGTNSEKPFSGVQSATNGHTKHDTLSIRSATPENNKPSVVVDPFSPVPSSQTARVTEDLFANFTPTTGGSMTFSAPPPSSAQQSIFELGAWPTVTPQNKVANGPSVSPANTNTGDKYAALAELDGLFKCASSSSAEDKNALLTGPLTSNQSLTTRWPDGFTSAPSSNTPSLFQTPTTMSFQGQSGQNPFNFVSAPTTALPRHYSPSNPFTAQPNQATAFTTSASVPFTLLQQQQPMGTLVGRNPFVGQQQAPAFNVNPFAQTTMAANPPLFASTGWPAQPTYPGLNTSLPGVNPTYFSNCKAPTTGALEGNSTSNNVCNASLSGFKPFLS
ncbi:unnamed protein product [Calicophoron daubneyi]|uniref:Arf-GAP domain-containing protein n=1 Tax=Calicophoron daubneyi TaxID=300641 RepID=A0AAV2THI8_CALDB